MASRSLALSVTARRTINIDRVILTLAFAFAIMAVLVTWRAFAPAQTTSSAIRLETPRTVDFERNAFARP